MEDLKYYVKKHGFMKGVRAHMAINFLNGKPLEEINEMFQELSNKIDELKQENKELKEWIPVSERLPEFDKPVQVTFEEYPESVHLLCRQDIGADGWLWCEYKYGDINDPSNYEAEDEYNPIKWKPLPEPPKEGK